MDGEHAELETAALLDALCGAKVTINVPMRWSEVRYPRVSHTPVARETYSSDRPLPEDFLAASVMPDNALLVTLLVTAGGATFVDTHQCEGVLFMARPRYQLRGVMTDDSVVHAFMYRDRGRHLRLGIFDANKLGGEDVSALAPLQRHCRVYEAYHAAAAAGFATAYVLYHGVFYEHACLEIDTRELPFFSSSVLRLPLHASDLTCSLLQTAFVLPAVPWPGAAAPG